MVGVAKETGRFSLIYGRFNSPGSLVLVHHVSDLCLFGPKEPAATLYALTAFPSPDGLFTDVGLVRLAPTDIPTSAA